MYGESANNLWKSYSCKNFRKRVSNVTSESLKSAYAYKAAWVQEGIHRPCWHATS